MKPKPNKLEKRANLSNILGSLQTGPKGSYVVSQILPESQIDTVIKVCELSC